MKVGTIHLVWGQLQLSLKMSSPHEASNHTRDP